MTEYINYGETELPIDTAIIEAKRNATYIGDFALKGPNGWNDGAAQVYWQSTPLVKGYSHYFGIFVRDGSAYITSAQSIADVEISAIRSGDEIIYSRYRWDYRQTKDEKCAIDGGRDYTKIVGTAMEFFTLKLDGPELKIIERFSPKQFFEV